MKKPSSDILASMMLRQFAKLEKVREGLLEQAFSLKFGEDFAAHFSDVQVDGEVDTDIETMSCKRYSWHGVAFLVETVRLEMNYRDTSRKYTLVTEFRVPEVEQPNQPDSI